MKIYLDRNGLADALSVSDSTVEKLTRECSDFPKPRQISGRRVGWLVREIMDWADRRPISGQLPPPNTGCSTGRPKNAESTAQDDRKAA